MQFLEQVKSGNMMAIESLLSSTPELFGDGGGKVRAAGYVVGVSPVVEFMLALGSSEVFQSDAFKLEYHMVNSRPGVVISQKFSDGGWALNTILSFEFLDEKIARVYGQRNPDKLTQILPSGGNGKLMQLKK